MLFYYSGSARPTVLYFNSDSIVFLFLYHIFSAHNISFLFRFVLLARLWLLARQSSVTPALCTYMNDCLRMAVHNICRMFSARQHATLRSAFDPIRLGHNRSCTQRFDLRHVASINLTYMAIEYKCVHGAFQRQGCVKHKIKTVPNDWPNTILIFSTHLFLIVFLFSLRNFFSLPAQTFHEIDFLSCPRMSPVFRFSRPLLCTIIPFGRFQTQYEGCIHLHF